MIEYSQENKEVFFFFFFLRGVTVLVTSNYFSSHLINATRYVWLEFSENYQKTSLSSKQGSLLLIFYLRAR